MALTIRERNGLQLGTLQRPLPLAVNLAAVEPAPVVLPLTLGYDGQAPTAVWAFEGRRRMEVSVVRRSEDPLANAVGVVLLDAITHRQLGRLVSSDAGTGETVVVPAGRYLLVASLGLLEQVSVELLVRIAPPKVPLGGVAAGRLGGAAAWRSSLLHGACSASGEGQLLRSPSLEGAASSSDSALLNYVPVTELPNQISGLSSSAGSAAAAKSPFFWVDRRGRRLGPNVQITPLTYNQAIWRRSDYRLLLRARDGDTGLPLDLSGWSVTVAAYDGRRLVRYALLAVAPAGLAAGLIDASLGWEQTVDLPDVLYMDVLLNNGSGQQQYPLEGVWLMQDGYTA